MVDHQVLEPDSRLRERADLDLATLRAQVPGGLAIMYEYVMKTVLRREGGLWHLGSGPNIEGGLITLCTCKHYMRTFSGVQPGTWIAGFSSSRKGRNGYPRQRNTLFYLTQVQYAFASQMALWRSPHVPLRARVRKSARSNHLGDLYVPRDGAEAPFAIESYHPPMPEHSHAFASDEPGGWYRDIDFLTRYGRRPSLLVGDPQLSFVWTQPRIDSRPTIGRGQVRFDSMREFLASLVDARA